MQLPSIQTASPFSSVQPQDTGSASSSSSSSDSDSATITANDFLQLLVTEMKNQDPTSNTDPNEYINQLVGVNSLEQLVQINQDLGGGASSSSSSGSASVAPSHGNSAQRTPAPVRPAIPSAAPTRAVGNLSVTDTGRQSARLVTALGTAAQTLAPGAQSSPLSSALDALRAHASQFNPAR